MEVKLKLNQMESVHKILHKRDKKSKLSKFIKFFVKFAQPMLEKITDEDTTVVKYVDVAAAQDYEDTEYMLLQPAIRIFMDTGKQFKLIKILNVCNIPESSNLIMQVPD